MQGSRLTPGLHKEPPARQELSTYSTTAGRAYSNLEAHVIVIVIVIVGLDLFHHFSVLHSTKKPARGRLIASKRKPPPPDSPLRLLPAPARSPPGIHKRANSEPFSFLPTAGSNNKRARTALLLLLLPMMASVIVPRSPLSLPLSLVVDEAESSLLLQSSANHRYKDSV